MKITILGCGSSYGVPVIGCKCITCTSKNPKNNRTRSTILIEKNGKNFLVDTSPDFRFQALREDLTDISAVFFTHAHADHVMGIDDLKTFAFNKKEPITTYADKQTAESLYSNFTYIFDSRFDVAGESVSIAKMEIFEDKKIFYHEELKIYSFKQEHGLNFSMGFIFDDMVAYSTDFSAIDESEINNMASKKLKLWIADAATIEPIKVHSNLENTLRLIEIVQPQMAIITHMSHRINYEEISKNLPKNVFLAYDGQKISI
jgi:phosphoribosyl 1,2-cyclic phosphate phosphodiesterase